MNDLNSLLDRAAGDVGSPVDVHADLTRGHRALARTRRRRGAVGLAGVAALGVVGVGIGRVTTGGHGTASVGHDPSGTPSDSPTAVPTAVPTSVPTSGGPTTEGTVAPQPVTVGAFSFDQVPEGYTPQVAPPDDPGVAASLGVNLVTFATDNPPDLFPENFEGKLVVMFGREGPFGDKQEVDGRTYRVNTEGGGGYTQIYVRSRPDEPQGVLVVQYPDDTGWTHDQMIAFLSGIHLGPGAAAGGAG